MMQKFVFKLDAVLQYRRHQRDLCRQFLAEALSQEQVLIARQEHLESLRAIQIDEIRQLTSNQVVDIGRTVARRRHARQLTAEIILIERHRRDAARETQARRQDLIGKNQRVCALEKLAERQAAEHITEAERRTVREMEDTWLATHLHGARS
jgi:hypothetical protein